MAYATVDELGMYLGGDYPAGNAELLLDRASRRVDVLLVGARYPVDTAGLPTLAEHVTALRDATCAQVAWWDERGDLTGSGIADEYSSVSIGNVSLSRRGGQDSGGQSRYAPEALDYLHTAGLLPIRPHGYG